MEIRVLIDNEQSRLHPHLRTERGHSLHVRWRGRSLLLDTGMSERFAGNARALGIEIAEVETVVLSHGHVDHSGGLKHFLAVNQRATVFAASGVRERLWLSLFGLKKEVSLDPEVVIDARERLRLVTDDSEPEEGLHLLVHVPDDHPRPLGNQLLLSGPASRRYLGSRARDGA